MALGASQLVAELIGEAFIDAIQKSRHRSVERARAVWQWLRHVAEAPPGVELVSPDGARFTGLVLVERSRAILMIALRHVPKGSDRFDARRSSSPDSPFPEPELFEERVWWDSDGPFRP